MVLQIQHHRFWNKPFKENTINNLKRLELKKILAMVMVS